eukprot:9487393-Pyramimonas_sp.AAC.1
MKRRRQCGDDRARDHEDMLRMQHEEEEVLMKKGMLEEEETARSRDEIAAQAEARALRRIRELEEKRRTPRGEILKKNTRSSRRDAREGRSADAGVRTRRGKGQIETSRAPGAGAQRGARAERRTENEEHNEPPTNSFPGYTTPAQPRKTTARAGDLAGN